MTRAIGFHAGLRGDLIMGTVCARSFKEQHPDSHLTLAVGPQFKDLLPLFHDSQYDSTHVWSTYEGCPGSRDVEYLRAACYDIVFHPMPQHRDQQWWTLRHQYAETCHMVGLPIPSDICPKLTRWFSPAGGFHNRVVAFAPFGGNGGVNDKQLSVAQAQAIVDWLTDHDWTVLHLGAPTEPQLDGAKWMPGSYFDSVRNMLSCRALIHCDTGMGHVAGAYNHPSLGLYAYRYFGREWAHQIRPIHSNHVAVEASTMAEIELDTITKALTLLL